MKNRKFGFFVILLMLILYVSPVFSNELTLEDLLAKVQSNQSKINDMYAETTTTITSNMAFPGAQSKGPSTGQPAGRQGSGRGPQKMVQKGRMWIKGQDKSKIEILSPMKQITITNGDEMAIINSETGQKMIQDLSKMKQGQSMGQGSKQIGLEEAKKHFDLSLDQTEDGDYVITGIPKKTNKFLTKMEFYLDSSTWVPTKILMYTSGNKLLSQTNMEYKKISDIYVPVKTVSVVNSPVGKMDIEMKFEKIKVNEGIEDDVFAIN